MEDRQYQYLAHRLTYGDTYFLSGAAGVGKSYFTNNLVAIAKDQGLKVAVTSSTGVSATLINGTTLHRLLSFGIDTRKENLQKFISGSYFKFVISKMLKELDFIVVDEISMTVSMMIDSLDFLMKIAKKSELPFGGCGILFVGDLLQCPPVNKEKVEKIWCFQSDAWTKAGTQLILLEKVHRQSDPTFIHLLHSIRVGIVDAKCEEILKTLDKPFFEDAPVFVGTNEEARKINEEKLHEIDEQMYESFAMMTGQDQKTMDSFKNDLIAEEKLLFKAGCRVIMLKNDPNNGYYNGTLATIIKLKNNDVVQVQIDGQKGFIEVERHSWERKNLNDKTIARFVQFPFKPAYAITVEKSQGMTLDRANFDPKRVFTPGKFYTGISRVKTLDGLRIKNFYKNVVKVDQMAIDYYKNTPNVMDKIVQESMKDFAFKPKTKTSSPKSKNKGKSSKKLSNEKTSLDDL